MFVAECGRSSHVDKEKNMSASFLTVFLAAALLLLRMAHEEWSLWADMTYRIMLVDTVSIKKTSFLYHIVSIYENPSR